MTGPKGILGDGSYEFSAELWLYSGETTWPTSVLFDRKRDCFLLPVKAAARHREGLDEGDQVTVHLALRAHER